MRAHPATLSATKTQDQIDTDLTADDPSEDITVNNDTDLVIAKTVDDTTPDEGQTVTYTVTLTNNGPARAENISVTDIVPAGVTYVAASITGGDSSDDTDPAGAGLSWTVNTINSGANTTLSFQATVDAGTSGNIITNTATKTQDQTDTDLTADDPSEDITVNNNTDLAVSKTVDNNAPDEGATITYTITVANNGPAQATNVSLTDLLPAGVTYSSDTPSQGSYVSGTGVWTVGTINSGASATLDIQATVDAGTSGSTITNTITVVSLDQTDSNATADDLSEDITVGNGTDLVVTKTVDNGTPDEGATITYTITVTNSGPAQATTVSLTDLLPAGVTYSSDTPSQGAYVSGTGVWTVGTINSGASTTLDIQATVDA
ncbi:MAG: COG1361 S-layer family protein, partial [Planctomycetota bacterium]